MKFFANASDTMLDPALFYANKGLHIFPTVYNPEIHEAAIVSAEFNAISATANTEEVEKLWKGYAKKALISVSTGKKSGIIVISVTEKGQKEWERWVRESSLELDAVTCQKNPKGFDYIFRAPEQSIYRAEIEPGIKIRGERDSFPIAPSSCSIEMGYKQKNLEIVFSAVTDVEPTEIPAEMLDKILKSPAGRDPSAESNELVEKLKLIPSAAEKTRQMAAKLAAERLDNLDDDGLDPQEDEEPSFAEALPKLPLDALPKKLVKLIRGVSDVFCVDEWLPFAAALKTASTIVGANIVLKHRQTSPGHTWLCLIGAPSLGKSEITRFFGEPVFNLEKMFCQRYACALEEYKEELKEIAAQEAEDKKKGEKNRRKEPKPPIKTTMYVDDITPESLVNTLAQNPGGVSWDCDEIRALLSSFGRYGGKGSGEAAKARLLSMYSGSPVKVDRKGAEASLFVPNAWLSIFGTVQPSILPKIFEKEDRASGFLQRFMFIHAEGTPPTPTGQRPNLDKYSGFVSEIFGGMAAQVKRIRPMEPGNQEPEEEINPFVVRLDPDAADAFDVFIDRIKLQAFYLSGQGEDAEEAQSRAGRWCDQFPRLLLLLHCLESVSGGYEEIKKNIKKDTVTRARAVFTALMKHSVSAWEKIKEKAKKEAPRSELLEIIGKYMEQNGEVYELHFAKTTPTGQKIADAILDEIGTANNDQMTRQALSKSLIAMNFAKFKTKLGNKYTITASKYEKLLAALAEKKKPASVLEIRPDPVRPRPSLVEAEMDNFLDQFDEEAESEAWTDITQ